MNTTQPAVEAELVGIGSMRAAASWFIQLSALPRHGEVEGFDQDFHRHLNQLLPLIEELATRRDSDNVPAKAALAGVGEARRRLTEPEAAGLNGEVARVKRLARSVLALCDHHDTLTGGTLCLVCDRAIENGQTSVSYDQASPSGGAARSGRIHADCTNTVIRTGR
ncbi:DUF6415 family natural product biosynthesis protein [Streptomyces pilosus]|uniref:DUF6415 family natural product biosynthesis protein n=1 Tax=Streptomyces pilosus TaxID=28893 RepID=UPI0036FD13B8